MPSHELPATESLPLYLSLFEKLGWLAAIGMVPALLLLPLMNRLSRQHQRCAEERRESAAGAGRRHRAVSNILGVRRDATFSRQARERVPHWLQEAHPHREMRTGGRRR